MYVSGLCFVYCLRVKWFVVAVFIYSKIITADVVVACNEVISTNAEYETSYPNRVASVSRNIPITDRFRICDIDLEELIELRRFIDPEVDISCLEGISELFDQLNHILD